VLLLLLLEDGVGPGDCGFGPLGAGLVTVAADDDGLGLVTPS
jgi:hypothetical protein